MNPSRCVALLALLALAVPADALFESHLDDFGTTVDSRIAALPATGGTKSEAKQRKALLKAQAALLLPSADRIADMGIAKKASAAVQKVLAADAELLGSLDIALDDYRTEADDAVLECEGLLSDFPPGPAAERLSKKLDSLGGLLGKEAAAALPSSRAALLGKVFKKLVPIKEALAGGTPGGPCDPPVHFEDTNHGTMTAVIDGVPWSSTDVEVMLIVDSVTNDVIQLGLSAEHPDGSGGFLDKLEFHFDVDAYQGVGTFPFNTSAVGPVSMSYQKSPNWFQSLTGTVTVSEFSFTPTLADSSLASGRLAGTFSFNGCTVWAGSDTCGALPVTVTSGTFDVCNFNVVYW